MEFCFYRLCKEHVGVPLPVEHEHHYMYSSNMLAFKVSYAFLFPPNSNKHFQGPTGINSTDFISFNTIYHTIGTQCIGFN